MPVTLQRITTTLLIAYLAILFIAGCGGVPQTSLTLDHLPEGRPTAQINDSLWAEVLHNDFNERGAIKLTALENDSDLTGFLTAVALVQPDAFNSRPEQLAFWINAHNAYVLDLIRKNPARSTDDISGFRYAKVIPVGDGKTYSLDDIEHTIIEKRFREPRAFFALYDGTRSSPLLRKEPYRGETLSDELDTQLRGFIVDSTKNYLDRRANILYLSKIFSEYKPTLEEMSGVTLATIVRDFAPPTISEWISRHSNLSLSYLRYDYTIDETDLPRHEPTNERKHPTPRRSSGGIE